VTFELGLSNLKKSGGGAGRYLFGLARPASLGRVISANRFLAGNVTSRLCPISSEDAGFRGGAPKILL
jgi:hypothetical protein